LQDIITRDKLPYMITNVEINESIQKQLDKDIRDGLFEGEVRDLIAFWIMEIKEIGYEEYIKSPLANAFNDHALRAKRQGQRAIHLNPKGGRLIYRYFKNKIIVKVIKITPDHDYK
jgi:mRNA-degrading endonuclease YafQ of YafQ-DinJ toxin-antitoxin module